jgi:outer membrane protein assembly factor BamE (lipoprotein component of BamABCDE complex)
MRWQAAAWLLAAAVLAGCAQGFKRPPQETLRLGESTPDELIGRLGPPNVRNKLERNSRSLDAMTWVYVNELDKPHMDPSIVPSRALTLLFDQGRLVGHEFASTFAADHTNFSLVRLREVERGKTTRAQVQELMGTPAGALAFPLVDTRAGAMVYSYRETRRVPFGQPVNFTKTLIIKFNEDGTVNDYVYQTSGTP